MADLSNNFRASLRDLAVRRSKYLIPDPELKRYKREELKDYIKDCCKNYFFIEAYALTLQYVDDLIYYGVKIKGSKNFPNNSSQIVDVLKGVKALPENFLDLYEVVNETRNALLHKVVKYPQRRKQISQITPDTHFEKLSALIEIVEDFFLYLVKKYPDRFKYLFVSKKLSAEEKIKEELLLDVLSFKVEKTINLPYDFKNPGIWKEEFKNEFKTKFSGEIRKLFNPK